MTTTAYVALGSNIEPRRTYLGQAASLLRVVFGLTKPDAWHWSATYETAAVGGPPGQGLYLNHVVSFLTDFAAPEVLLGLQEIETKLGRVRTEHFGPRPIATPLLLYA